MAERPVAIQEPPLAFGCSKTPFDPCGSGLCHGGRVKEVNIAPFAHGFESTAKAMFDRYNIFRHDWLPYIIGFLGFLTVGVL